MNISFWNQLYTAVGFEGLDGTNFGNVSNNIQLFNGSNHFDIVSQGSLKKFTTVGAEKQKSQFRGKNQKFRSKNPQN